MFFRSDSLILTLSLFSIASAVQLRCTYVHINWAITGTQYACEALVVNETEIREVTEIHGTHAVLKGDDDVGLLSFLDDDTVTEMPIGIEKFFTNLKGLRWHDGILTSVSQENFKPFPQLQVLVLSSNNLTSLDGDLLESNLELREIYFRFNQIETIGFEFFANLNLLEKARFEKNVCIDMNAEDAAEMPELIKTVAEQCHPETTEPPEIPPDPRDCPEFCDQRVKDLETKLEETVELYEKRLSKLETQMIELKANPCTTCWWRKKVTINVITQIVNFHDIFSLFLETLCGSMRSHKMRSM